MGYALHLLIYFDIYVIVALSLNLVVGYCGLLNLAHAGYFALGAYAYALLSVVAGWSFVPALLVAVALATLLSLAVSLASWRLKGDFFVLASLAVQALLYGIFYNWSDATDPLGSWKNLTNGPFGINAIPKPSLLGLTISDPAHYLIFASCITGIIVFVLWRLKTSPWGRALVSMREDELAARSLGKNTRLMKVQAIALACGIVSVAGVLYAGYIGYLDPGTASIDESVLMLSMVMVGGVGNIRGPVIGALILILMPEALRFMDFPATQAANIRLAVYGLLLVLMMHFRPQGVSGEYRLN